MIDIIYFPTDIIYFPTTLGRYYILPCKPWWKLYTSQQTLIDIIYFPANLDRYYILPSKPWKMLYTSQQTLIDIIYFPANLDRYYILPSKPLQILYNSKKNLDIYYQQTLTNTIYFEKLLHGILPNQNSARVHLWNNDQTYPQPPITRRYTTLSIRLK